MRAPRWLRRRQHHDQGHVAATCLLPGCPAPTIASHVPLADALAAQRAHEARHHAAVRRTTCGWPVGGHLGLLCDLPPGHPGEHRHALGRVDLASATPDPGSDPDDGAPRLLPPERRATWHRG